MKLTQAITRTSLAAVALLNLTLASAALAEPIVVTRGPNGAAHVVQSDNIPIDAKLLPNNKVRQFPKVVQKGPGGAAHLVRQAEPKTQTSTQAKTPRLIRRGTHGAFFLSTK